MPTLKFVVGARATEKSSITLIPDNWDDYRYETLFQAVFIDTAGTRHSIGGVKLGEFGLVPGPRSEHRPGVRRPTIPAKFKRLDPARHFSLGQDTSYYENLARLGDEFRLSYLRSMNDISFYDNLRDRALPEEVTQTSLLRTVSARTVEGQFKRLASGGPALEEFNLEFPIRDSSKSPRLVCHVRPQARPPENIQVVIGRNGAGKSTTLHNIARMMVEGFKTDSIRKLATKQQEQIANLVSVSFSAFDEFEPLDAKSRYHGLTYHYIGLKTYATEHSFAERTTTRTRTSAELTADSVDSIDNCLHVDGKRERLIESFRLLEADPNFATLGLSHRFQETNTDDSSDALRETLDYLSSGHKIVILTVAKLVETVAEKTLVLMDEPEAHLHPPLLSAFIRSLSALLADRNGLAIVATHSPVVLQEVPKSCVKILDNFAGEVELRQPILETFGENVGTLTTEVFGLEVTGTGFHAILQDLATEFPSYDQALGALEGQLGTEGRAILRSTIAAILQTRDVDR